MLAIERAILDFKTGLISQQQGLSRQRPREIDLVQGRESRKRGLQTFVEVSIIDFRNSDSIFDWRGFFASEKEVPTEGYSK